jgi:hypothetical protein
MIQEVNRVIGDLRYNVAEINEARSPEELKTQYREIKQAIEADWPRMLASRTPTASYYRTREFKELRNRKSELRTDPNAYVDKLHALHARMFDPATAIQDEIEVQPLKRSNLLQMIRIDYTNVLHKLENLPDNGLGNENESRQDLIRMYKIIDDKFDKTVKKLNRGAILGLVPFIITIGVSEIPLGKKHNNLLKSATIYHNWLITIDRQIDAFQNRNQRQTGTQAS